MMKITRVSPRTGQKNSMELPITLEQLRDYSSGTHIQRAFPNLTADQREFILTGYTKEDWDALFPPEEEEDDSDLPLDMQEWNYNRKAIEDSVALTKQAALQRGGQDD